MAGIYFHIPFCKQACHYCNFHFSTSLHYKSELLASLVKELTLRKEYVAEERIETIYFGGGTPSLLETEEIATILNRIQKEYSVADDAEITLEANPDDIHLEKLLAWRKIGINRLSIGLQSFDEEELKWMNRAHTAQDSLRCLEEALTLFDNISVDLIYGSPLLSHEQWQKNVFKIIELGIPHISCYALTVEPKTPLEKQIRQHQKLDVDPDKQAEQFSLLINWLAAAGYEHYEISNFSKPGKRSKHNTSYWQGQTYLGIGPSAHSFNGESRQWNVANNQQYITALSKNTVPSEVEILNAKQKLNEYIMTALRTMEGIDLNKIASSEKTLLLKQSEKFIHHSLVKLQDEHLILTKDGKFLADGIAADLFV